ALVEALGEARRLEPGHVRLHGGGEAFVFEPADHRITSLEWLLAPERRVRNPSLAGRGLPAERGHRANSLACVRGPAIFATLPVAVAQLVECRIVVPVVAGSKPVGHPA